MQTQLTNSGPFSQSTRKHSIYPPAEGMGPLAVEAEGMPELFIHGLHNLADSRQPAAEPLGPRHAAIALRRAEDLGTIGPPPSLVGGLPLEALVDDIRPTGRGAHACQARVGMTAQGKERLRQGLIFGTSPDFSRGAREGIGPMEQCRQSTALTVHASPGPFADTLQQ
jgi:hypothetical protein